MAVRRWSSHTPFIVHNTHGVWGTPPTAVHVPAQVSAVLRVLTHPTMFHSLGLSALMAGVQTWVQCVCIIAILGQGFLAKRIFNLNGIFPVKWRFNEINNINYIEVHVIILIMIGGLYWCCDTWHRSHDISYRDTSRCIAILWARWYSNFKKSVCFIWLFTMLIFESVLNSLAL